MSNEEKNTRMQRRLPERTLPLEIAAEFILPDYHSEISRLLWVHPTVLPPASFQSGGKAELSGKILFQILYVGPDNRLCSLTQESGYTFTLPADWSAEESLLLATPVADSVISRVVAPRKLSVRCKMHAGVEILESVCIAPQINTDDPALCRLCDVERAGRLLACEQESFSLADCVEVEESTRFILARGSVLFSDVGCEEGAVRCRGELLLTLLLCKEQEGALPYTVMRRLPFEQSVPLPGVTPMCHACAEALVGEIDVTVEEGHLDSVAQVTLSAIALREEPVLFYRDAFLPGCDTACRYAEIEVLTPVCCTNRHFSLSAERALADLGVGEEIAPLDGVATVEIREITQQGGKSILCGELSCRLLYQKGEELACSNATFPLRLPIEECKGELHVQASVVGLRLSVLHGVLHADTELQLTLRCCKPAPHRILCEASVDTAKATPRDGNPELYYPGAEETLWEVAKRYGVSPAALALQNGLSDEAPGEPESLGGKRFLLI